jgi:hypothetical protein
MEIKIQVIICNRHLDYLPCTSLPLARLTNNKQVNKARGILLSHFRKIVKIWKSNSILFFKSPKQKTYLEYYNIQLGCLSYYNGAFTLDVKSMLNVNLGGILGGTQR